MGVQVSRDIALAMEIDHNRGFFQCRWSIAAKRELYFSFTFFDSQLPSHPQVFRVDTLRRHRRAGGNVGKRRFAEVLANVGHAFLQRHSAQLQPPQRHPRDCPTRLELTEDALCLSLLLVARLVCKGDSFQLRICSCYTFFDLLLFIQQDLYFLVDDVPFAFDVFKCRGHLIIIPFSCQHVHDLPVSGLLRHGSVQLWDRADPPLT
mmetsp:Transcript_57751/g.108215  ORF Transcript_57751/g.108215 Transcript_57751/m.108215 type:complete len:206 (-) Transcript_57751:9-626(-)